MTVTTGEDDSDRWMNFEESWEDYCLLEQVYGRDPQQQIATFRVAFGEANRQLLRNLDLGKVIAGDQTDALKTRACKSLAERTYERNRQFLRKIPAAAQTSC